MWLSVVEDEFEPAGAAADELSGVALTPALDEADLHGESGVRLMAELVVVGSLQALGLLVVKGFNGKARKHFVYEQRS